MSTDALAHSENQVGMWFAKKEHLEPLYQHGINGKTNRCFTVYQEGNNILLKLIIEAVV